MMLNTIFLTFELLYFSKIL